MENKSLTALPIRTLDVSDFPGFRSHLKRLDSDTLRLRFGHAVGADFIDAYVDTAYRVETLIVAAFEGADIRASGELRGVGGIDGDGEAAFAVERRWQDQGLGSQLMERIVSEALTRGFGRLHMICLRENARMRHIAAKCGAQLRFMEGEVMGELDPRQPASVPLREEVTHSTRGFVNAVLDWQR